MYHESDETLRSIEAGSLPLQGSWNLGQQRLFESMLPRHPAENLHRSMPDSIADLHTMTSKVE